MATNFPKKAKNYFIFRTLVTLATIQLRYLGLTIGLSMPKILPDEQALNEGERIIEDFLVTKSTKVIAKKVMYGNEKVFGVHLRLSGGGYSYLKGLSVDQST